MRLFISEGTLALGVGSAARWGRGVCCFLRLVFLAGLVLLAFVVPASIATAGLGLLAISVFFCKRYRGFGFAGVAWFLLRSLPRVWLGIIFFIFIDLNCSLALGCPAAIATAGLRCDYIFYFH
jgi:hypothetical protein